MTPNPKRKGIPMGSGVKDLAETLVPVHLQGLLQPTPSGTAKLIAAWDGLTPETQIAVFGQLAAEKELAHRRPRYLSQQIITKALTSNNAFVRYMAAREADINENNEQANNIRKQIENDTEPLVRYTLLETESAFRSGFDDPEKFFALPHEARLAKIRRLTNGGEEVAKLISYAVEHQLKNGQVSEIEICELLSDYLNKPEFKERYCKDPFNYDGYDQYKKGKDIEALWELVLKVPEDIQDVITQHLPEGAGYCRDIPKHVLDSMSDQQLITLFYRPDISLEKFRKQKFFETLNDDSKNFLMSAAVDHAFDLTNEEFAELLSKPDKPRRRILVDLSLANDMRLCLYLAIHDAIFYGHMSDFEDAEWARRTFVGKLKELEGWRRDKELRELRLYRLAVLTVPWEKGEKGARLTGELAFLEEAVVEGDTWATFEAFTKKWNENNYGKIKLERLLPRIREAGEEDNWTPEEDDADDADRLADRVADKLTVFLDTALGELDGENSGLARAFDELNVNATVAHERTLEAVNSMKAELTGLRHAHTQALNIHSSHATVTQEKTLEAVNSMKAELTGLRTVTQEKTLEAVNSMKVELTGLRTVTQEKTLEAVNSIKVELTGLRYAHNRQLFLSWIVVGVLVVLLFVGR